MSRIGRQPVPLPRGVTLQLEEGCLEVTGPKGSLRSELPGSIRVEVAGDRVVLERADDSKESRSLHGLARALISNMVVGVTEGFVRELEIHGVGYRAETNGKVLKLALGFSHPVEVSIPEGLGVAVNDNRIRVEGSDRRLVGQFASDIRKLRPPEPYKGKGIRFADERVRRKVGKAGTA